MMIKFIYIFIFFTCLKKTNQQRNGERKDSLPLGPALRDYPVLLAKSGRFGKSRSLHPLAGYSAESFSRTSLRCSAA